MTGMGDGLSETNPTVVSAFQSALVRQGLIVLVILAVLAVAWNVLRTMQLRRAAAGDAGSTQTLLPLWPEPTARRVLRVAFGLIWVFDGILQGQGSMPLGMIPGVVQPAASGSPGWVQALVGFGEKVWGFHPVPAAAAAVWIQVGIGLWLLAAPRGRWSQAAGVASVAWGLNVWVFGEAFGAIFAPGLSWLTGAPGAVLFYCAAGVLVALPERAWSKRRLGVVILRGMGAFFLGMALLQAWPGRGYWQGGTSGSLPAMESQMSSTPQPHFLSSWVTAFGNFDSSHGWAVNLVVVIALAGIGAALMSARPSAVRVTLVAAIVLCLADWVLVEDLGFMGGVGTDPNSMIPMLVVLSAGYLALMRPAAVAGPAVVPLSAPASGPLVERLAGNPTYALRAAGALGALGIVLLGVVPMAEAATNPTADPILSEAVNGTPGATDSPTPSFSLVDQNGQPVTLASLRGKAVAITFLDPVCTSDCPVIAQEFREADSMLGGDRSRVALVAINANPVDTATAFLRAFDAEERLDQVGNWRYLTGSTATLESVWNDFGVQVAVEPGGAMVAHSELTYVIDPHGRTRYILDTDPGSDSWASQSSFSGTLAQAIETTLRS